MLVGLYPTAKQWLGGVGGILLAICMTAFGGIALNTNLPTCGFPMLYLTLNAELSIKFMHYY
ncbi:hypothetical protein C1H71_09645 [Iodobacter fluviatilis]|uniref:Uncharacterized protein n=1 Tax=Iodobacter fluviatilis TaxID=537 RepID=A0A7G3G9E5_9NEIS|nr:hypothetical protein C1H71_09645 [Iodobacter fluviatilis]